MLFYSCCWLLNVSFTIWIKLIKYVSFKYFLPVYALVFFFLTVSFEEQKFSFLWCLISYFLALYIILLMLLRVHRDFSYMLYSKKKGILHFILRFLIPYELFFFSIVIHQSAGLSSECSIFLAAFMVKTAFSTLNWLYTFVKISLLYSCWTIVELCILF